uniref:CSD domain-containing protein n=1 Tax=Anisakis simplex TaxID=6269 RepID=A0A0M3JKY5_ANISI
LRTLANGEEVLFDIAQGPKGYQAVNVSGPNGENVPAQCLFLLP